jgi:hypothetical protein
VGRGGEAGPTGWSGPAGKERGTGRVEQVGERERGRSEKEREYFLMFS